MNVLLIGSGGREHALAWKLRQSKLVDTIFCSPGNPGMHEVVTVPAKPLAELAEFAQKNQVGLTVVGPEVPLCSGIVDVFRERGLRIVGPDRNAAQLEGSKSFAKQFMSRHGLPTAKAKSFQNEAEALAWARSQGTPLVVKADGLAAGKGVVVAMTLSEVEEALRACFSGTFGPAGTTVLIEECLFGEEASIIALCDGQTIVPLATSQDHKRAGDGDTGPNTGGMGAYSPAPVVTPELDKIIDAQILQPFLQGCQKDGLDFRGVIYAGLMITDQGPKVLEFNVRFGDPETQPIMMRLKSDLLQVLCATADGKLAGETMEWHAEPAVCVVMAAEGYPGEYQKGMPIQGVEQAEAMGAVVFHAGTTVKDGQLLTAGGRVLGVTAKAETLQQAVDKAYQAVDKINWPGAWYRKDIAAKALTKLN